MYLPMSKNDFFIKISVLMSSYPLCIASVLFRLFLIDDGVPVSGVI